MRQSSDRAHIASGTMRFDQYMYRHIADYTGFARRLADISDHLGHLADVGRFGDRDKGYALAGLADYDVDILSPRGMRRIMNSSARFAEPVAARVNHTCDHGRMFALLPRRSTVFAIAGYIED